MKTRPPEVKHYMSKEYQLEVMQDFHTQLNGILLAYDRKKQNKSKIKSQQSEDISLILEKIKLKQLTDVSKQYCIYSLYKTIENLTKEFEAKVNTQNSANQNNTDLLTYIDTVITKLKAAQESIKLLEESKFFMKKSTMPGKLEKVITEWQKKRKFFEHAVDVKIYEVLIPKQQYDAFMAQSHKFLNQRVKKSAEAAASIPLFVPKLFLAFGSILMAVSGNVEDTMYFGDISVKLAGSVYLKFNAFTQYGHACQSGIPKEWISHMVISKSQSEEKGLPNPNYNTKIDGSEYKRIYVLDATDPNRVFEHGIGYLAQDANPNGSVIFFENYNDAVLNAVYRGDGSLYHEYLGWKEHGAWQESEIAEIMEKTQLPASEHKEDAPPVVIHTQEPPEAEATELDEVQNPKKPTSP